MARKRGDSDRAIKENKMLRRENGRLRKRISALGSMPEERFSEEEEETPAPKQKAKPSKLTGAACKFCGSADTNELDLGIRRYSQCHQCGKRDRIA